MANKTLVDNKAQAVSQLSELMKGAKSFVLCEFAGITVKALEELRRELAKSNCSLKVVTNNTIKRAAEAYGIKEMDSVAGPTAIVFSNNECVDGAKILADFQKKNKKLKLKDGVVEGTYYDKSQVVELSKLPSRVQLLAMIAGGMYQPLQQLSLGLNMIAEQKN